MHLTCKNTPVTPDRKDLKIRSEKDQEESLSKPLLDATYPSEPNRYLLDRLRQLCSEKRKRESRNQLFDMPVLGLADCHSRRLENSQRNCFKRAQVRPGDQPGYPTDTIESFVGHSSMGLLCPLHEIKKIRVRSFTSFQTVPVTHTDTHTHTRDTYCNDL